MPRINRPLATLAASGPALGLLSGLGALGAAWYASQQINPLPRRSYMDSYTFTPWELGVPFERLTLPTSDGLNLAAWWLPQPAAQHVVICCHGHIGSKPDLLGIGTGLWRAGHHVLLFDFRGRGESDVWPNTLAHGEVDDLLAAVAYARTRLPDARIGVVGFSMGAAVALLAAARTADISAVVADSAFTSAHAVVAHHVQQRMPLVGAALLPLIEALIARQYGYTLGQVRPIEAIAQLAPRPVLLIHAANDSMIPLDHVHQLYAAASQPRQLWVYPAVEHCGAYFDDRSGYVDRVGRFFQQYLAAIEAEA